MACGLLRPARGTVWVLYVIQVPRSLPLDAELPAEAARGEQVLQHMEHLGKMYKCRVEGEILQARGLGPAVVREAEERNVDILVTGMPYQEDYGTPTIGDFVPFLLKHSPCRVLVLREAQTAANRDGRWS
jgi:hypothetical protein